MGPAFYLGCCCHGARHFHLRLHKLSLRGHGGDFRADSIRATLLLPQMNQLLGQNLTCPHVTGLGHFLDFCLLEGEKGK